MELRCNTYKWSYQYIIADKYKDVKWEELEVKVEEDHFARWQLMVKDCIGLLIAIAKNKNNNSELEDIIQDSYMAYQELYSNIIRLNNISGNEEIKSEFINEVRKYSNKNNMYGANISNKELKTRYLGYNAGLINEFVINGFDNNSLPFSERLIAKIRTTISEEEYKYIHKHYHLGKSESLELIGLSTTGYSSRIWRIRKKIETGLKGVDLYECL